MKNFRTILEQCTHVQIYTCNLQKKKYNNCNILIVFIVNGVYSNLSNQKQEKNVNIQLLNIENHLKCLDIRIFNLNKTKKTK